MKLIRLHFIDDENKTRDLLTMVNESLSSDKKYDMTLLEMTYLKLEEKENEIKKLKEENNQLKEKIKIKKNNKISS